MKNSILTALFIIFSFTSFSQKGQQTVGISFSPNSTLDDELKFTNFGLGAGLFFNYQITRRLGFRTGANYLPVKSSETGFLCFAVVGAYCPQVRNYNFNIVEFPFLFSLNTNWNQDAQLKFYFTGGYSLGRIVSVKVEDKFYDGSNKIYNLELTEKERNLNIFNFGFEVRHDIVDDYQLSLASNFKYTYRYSVMQNDIYNFSLMFGIGKLL